VQGCSDEHLANTIQWLDHYSRDQEMKDTAREEAKRRGLSDEFLARAQFPYKDGLGNWTVWCFETHAPKSVGTYVRG